MPPTASNKKQVMQTMELLPHPKQHHIAESALETSSLTRPHLIAERIFSLPQLHGHCTQNGKASL